MIDRMIELVKPPASTSYSQVADILSREFNVKLSRSAIAGKLRRLGMSNTMAKPPPAPRPSRAKPDTAKAFKPAPILPATETIALAPSADALNVSFAQLEDGMCKWSTGEDMYCGHATGPREPYCAAHRKAGTTAPRYSINRLVGRARRQ